MGLEEVGPLIGAHQYNGGVSSPALHRYSQFCSRLAASGKVVLAIEHRDGTGPACMPRSWNEGEKSEPRPFLYLQESDIR
jgi:hypothetical protein